MIIKKFQCVPERLRPWFLQHLTGLSYIPRKPYTEDTEGDGVRMNAFGHEDADVAFDPLSANRRFAGTADMAVLGTLVFAGPTRESISVMVPDCIVPPASGVVRVDLCHHVSLSLGPALDMASWVPEPNMERVLCPASLADTLGLQRREYWDELNPILSVIFCV